MSKMTQNDLKGILKGSPWQKIESIDTCVLFGHDTLRKIWSIWILVTKYPETNGHPSNPKTSLYYHIPLNFSMSVKSD